MTKIFRIPGNKIRSSGIHRFQIKDLSELLRGKTKKSIKKRLRRLTKKNI